MYIPLQLPACPVSTSTRQPPLLLHRARFSAHRTYRGRQGNSYYSSLWSRSTCSRDINIRQSGSDLLAQWSELLVYFRRTYYTSFSDISAGTVTMTVTILDLRDQRHQSPGINWATQDRLRRAHCGHVWSERDSRYTSEQKVISRCTHLHVP